MSDEQYNLLINIAANIEKAVSAMEATSAATTKVAQASEDASKKVEELKQKMDNNAQSAGGLVKSFSGVATSAWALYQGYDNLIDSQLGVEKSMLKAKSSANIAEDSQKKYNDIVAKFGPASEQAVAAAKDLEIAQEKAALAQDSAAMATQNLKEKTVSFALGVLPAGITMVDNLGKSMNGLSSFLKASKGSANIAGEAIKGISAGADLATKSTGGLGGAFSGLMPAMLPILPIVAVIAAIAAALYLAYTNCEPFKQAVDQLAVSLGKALGVAIEMVSAYMGWWLDNILIPIINVLATMFIPVIKAVADTLNWLVGIWNDASGKTQKANEAMSKSIQAETQKQIDEVNKKYAALEKVEADSYKKQIDDTAKAWSEKLDKTLTGFDKVVEEYNKHYDDLEKDVQSALDDELSAIEDAYKDQTDAMNDEYDNQIDATETLYDELMGIIDQGLKDIKDARDGELDDLELNYLTQRQLLKSNLDDEHLTQEEFDEQMKIMEDTYRIERAKISDQARMDELTYEKTHKGELEKLEEEKALALKTIEEKRIAAMKVLQDTEATEEQKAKAESTLKLLDLQTQRKTDIEAIRADERTLATNHEEALKTLAQQKSDETNVIVSTGMERQRENRVLKQNEISSSLKTWWDAEIKTSADKVKAQTDAITAGWDLFKNSIAGTWKSIQNALSVAWGNIQSVASTIWGNITNSINGAINALYDYLGINETPTTPTSTVLKNAATNNEDGTPEPPPTPEPTPTVTPAPAPTPTPAPTPLPPVSNPPSAASTQMAIGGRTTPGGREIDYGAAEGFEGIVKTPTTFLTGESGPERVSIQPVGRGSSIPQTNNIHIEFSGPFSIRSEADIQALYQVFSERLRNEMKTRERYIAR